MSNLTKDSTFQEMLNVLNTLPVNPKKGATGNAQVNQVLSGITFSNIDNIDLVGTMPNKSGLANQTINKQNGEYTIAEGYYSGTTKVIANFANCVAGNIKSGVDIGGIIGSFEGGMKIAKMDISEIKITGTTYSVTNMSFAPKVIIFAYRGGSGTSYNSVRIASSEISFTQNYGYDSVEFSGIGGYPDYRPYTSWSGQDFGVGGKSLTITSNGFTANGLRVTQNNGIIAEWIAVG